MADYIDRQAAIEALEELIRARRGWLTDARGEIQGINASYCAIVDLPSAQKHGKWEGDDPITNFVCSVCGSLEEYDTDYCPNCGARMDGELDEIT